MTRSSRRWWQSAWRGIPTTWSGAFAPFAGRCWRGSAAFPGELIVQEASLGAALDRSADLSLQKASTAQAAEILKSTGFILHTAPFATFCFLRYGNDPLLALIEAVSAGGDPDSIAAILGAWLGALHGSRGLPQSLIRRLHDGPFGPTHLRALAACLARAREGQPAVVPCFSAAAALARNLALLPVVLLHGFRRMVPL